jgi:hypothetical protein
MDVDTILQICCGTGTGPSKPIVAEEGKPKPRSLKFTMMYNARYTGYYYVSPDSPNPHQAALDHCRHTSNEAWHGTPSDKAPGTWENYRG